MLVKHLLHIKTTTEKGFFSLLIEHLIFLALIKFQDLDIQLISPRARMVPASLLKAPVLGSNNGLLFHPAYPPQRDAQPPAPLVSSCQRCWRQPSECRSCSRVPLMYQYCASQPTSNTSLTKRTFILSSHGVYDKLHELTWTAPKAARNKTTDVFQLGMVPKQKIDL